jgi:hypothetical protein
MRAGLSSSLRRGIRKITEDGLDFVPSHPDPFSTRTSPELSIGYIDFKPRPQPEKGINLSIWSKRFSLFLHLLLAPIIDLKRLFDRSYRQQNHNCMSFAAMYLHLF